MSRRNRRGSPTGERRVGTTVPISSRRGPPDPGAGFSAEVTDSTLVEPTSLDVPDQVEVGQSYSMSIIVNNGALFVEPSDEDYCDSGINGGYFLDVRAEQFGNVIQSQRVCVGAGGLKEVTFTGISHSTTGSKQMGVTVLAVNSGTDFGSESQFVDVVDTSSGGGGSDGGDTGGSTGGDTGGDTSGFDPSLVTVESCNLSTASANPGDQATATITVDNMNSEPAAGEVDVSVRDTGRIIGEARFETSLGSATVDVPFTVPDREGETIGIDPRVIDIKESV